MKAGLINTLSDRDIDRVAMSNAGDVLENVWTYDGWHIPSVKVSESDLAFAKLHSPLCDDGLAMRTGRNGY